MKTVNLTILFLAIVFSVGCARLTEDVKVFAGTSTKALEEAKTTSGLNQSEVFKGAYPDIYRQVYDLLKKKQITLFLYSQLKHRIVAMHFLGDSDTTEVGIFFEEVGTRETKVIITSLSPGRLKIATGLIFFDLEKTYPVQ